jgi:hypothetical protein
MACFSARLGRFGQSASRSFLPHHRPDEESQVRESAQACGVDKFARIIPP